MCRGGTVEDDSAEVEALRIAAEEKARAEEAARKKAEEEKFLGRLDEAYNTALGSAKNYFTTQGIDVTDFMDEITAEAAARKGKVPTLDGAPGTYFDNLGQSVFEQLQTGGRSKAGNELDKIAGAGFDRKLIADTADDTYIEQLLQEQFDDSRTKLDAQKARGILTDTGFAEALNELTRQRSGAKTNLDAISQALLETGRGGLRSKATEARSTIDNLRLGNDYDFEGFQGGLNQSLQDFFSSFGDKLRGSVDEDLFDLSKAFQRGGAYQGVTSTGYNADASSGIFDLFDEEAKKKKEDEDEEDKQLSPF